MYFLNFLLVVFRKHMDARPCMTVTYFISCLASYTSSFYFSDATVLLLVFLCLLRFLLHSFIFCFFGLLVGFCWTVKGGSLFMYGDLGEAVCPFRSVWLCDHPAGVTVCPSRGCDCVSIQEGVAVCPSRLCIHPGGCGCVSIQEGVAVCPSRRV